MVDDVMITKNDLDEIATLKVFLDNKFKIKDLGEAHYFSWHGNFANTGRFRVNTEKVCN